MKKIIGIFLIMLGFFAFCGPVLAQKEDLGETVGVNEGVSVVTSEAKTDYVLPFPGILPDHPLYNLKRLRDFVLEKLIADPLKKTEFYLLQADKRLQMGVGLTMKQNMILAESTISKGEKYLVKAGSILSGYKASGSSIPPYILERFTNSLVKHEEVLNTLIAGADQQTKAGLTESLMLVKKLQQDVAGLK